MDNIALQREEIKRVYKKISPFELKDKLINLAKESKKGTEYQLLDAGRGNPNWIAATPREAFFTFGQFAILESQRVWNEYGLAGMPKKEGITERFTEFAKQHENDQGMELLINIINYGIKEKEFNSDEWIYELVDGIIGDNYPHPDRMLKHAEIIVNDYLIQELGCKSTQGQFKTFAVEGGTAAMCYIFDTLIANNIFSKGDKIALMAPIFTPYLEIPHLPRYNFEVIKVVANEITEEGIRTWQYSSSEMKKLIDPDIKALFIVNPSNPASVAMSPKTVNQIKNIVENHNPNLMIITDDVYSTFVDNFRSLMADLPYNTIGVYSFSKYFGVTGWRLGTISLYENNVFDKLLKNEDEDKKQRARIRYGGLSEDPDNIAFIDRIVADSRQVALNHTAGLSTPQQVQMVFFSLFAILDRENKYKNLTKNICRRRQKLFFEGLKLDLRVDPLSAAYYTQFDLLEWATRSHSGEFANYLQETYQPVDILLKLAENYSIILLSGSGFHGSQWSIRISFANLNDESYFKIGDALHKILLEYVQEWKNIKK